MNMCKELLEVKPTVEEQQEYLEYKVQKDFFRNLEKGLEDLNKFDFSKDSRKVLLIAGAMVAFDKGTIHFLNQMAIENENERYILLSEVTAENRRKTELHINFEFICTPHLLAKEILVPYFSISVTDEMMKYVYSKPYLVKAVANLEARHSNIGQGYAIALSYYADLYIKKLLDKIRPDVVILWNEFYAFHMIFQHICKKNRITIWYMEFGCVPGTFVLESRGQQGESYPARHPYKFRKLSISRDEMVKAEKVKNYIYRTQINRNLQPAWGKSRFGFQQSGQPVITYMGQNDYESGIYPYTIKSRYYHSPVFKSTLQGLEYLEMLAIKNNWILVYKPHPIVASLGNGSTRDIKCIQINDINIHELIDNSDVIITIISQSAYEALFRDKPVVMLGRTQLYKSGCTYEAFGKSLIERVIKIAIQKGFTPKQKKCFLRHIAQVLKYYLLDDMMHPDFEYGIKLNKEAMVRRMPNGM